MIFIGSVYGFIRYSSIFPMVSTSLKVKWLQRRALGRWSTRYPYTFMLSLVLPLTDGSAYWVRGARAASSLDPRITIIFLKPQFLTHFTPRSRIHASERCPPTYSRELYLGLLISIGGEEGWVGQRWGMGWWRGAKNALFAPTTVFLGLGYRVRVYI